MRKTEWLLCPVCGRKTHDIPTEKEILATMEEIRNNPQDFKFVA